MQIADQQSTKKPGEDDKKKSENYLNGNGIGMRMKTVMKWEWEREWNENGNERFNRRKDNSGREPVPLNFSMSILHDYWVTFLRHHCVTRELRFFMWIFCGLRKHINLNHICSVVELML